MEKFIFEIVDSNEEVSRDSEASLPLSYFLFCFWNNSAEQEKAGWDGEVSLIPAYLSLTISFSK